MCNRKTKQWHINPKPAIQNMNVYCIVKKLKSASTWDRMEVHHEGADWAYCWPLTVKVCPRERVDELGDPLPLVFATSGTEQVMGTH